MSQRPVAFLDRFGEPMQRSRPGRPQALNSPSNIPYDSADIYGEHMAMWRPMLWSADTELNMYRDRIVSRTRDMARNDGWAAGGITRILDSAIGANFRPMAKPDHRALKAMTGIKAFDAVWAHEFGRAAEANYRTWANDPGCYCDIERGMNVPQLGYLGFRHKLLDGDALACARWEPERMGVGKAHYATAIQLLDPDRLSNPNLVFDMKFSRGGVVIDQYGAAKGYQIREAHPGDWYNAAESLTWQYIPRETDWGRPVIIHNFDRDRASQHRGGVGILSPILQRLKMLVKADTTELDAAVINSIFAAYLESPFDHSLLSDALGEESNLGYYQAGRSAFHDERKLLLQGARIPTLYPGEKFGTINPTRPNSNFEAFEGAILRNIASGMGITAQQLSQNWSDVNYSSARAAMIEMWLTMERRRASFASGFFHPIYLAWLEESMDSDDYPLPAGAPEFMEARAAYGKARWIGPAKGWVDPVAEKEGVWLGLEMGLSNLEDEAADQNVDWEENLDQLAVEKEAFAKRGLERPSWSGSSQSKPGTGGKPEIPGAPKPSKQEARAQ